MAIIPKIKLCWNGSKVEAEWHLGLFGIYTRGLAGGRLRGIVISGRGLLAWMIGLAIFTYFAGAGALWFWLDRRPYNRVTYADLVLPTRWSGVQKLRGQALVEEGMADIKERRWTEGISKLRVGIARNPDEINGRLVLAEIFLSMKAKKQAVDVYDRGLAVRYPGRNYIETMLKSCQGMEDHAWALRICDRALELVANDPALEDERAWLARRKLAVLVEADRPADAIKWADSGAVPPGPTLNEYRVLALLKDGKVSEAVAFLEQWRGAAGKTEVPQVTRLQVRAYREAKDFPNMERALEELRAFTPADPRPYVFAVVQQSLAGRHAEAGQAYERLIARFGSTPQTLQLLGAPLAEIMDRPLLERLLGHARQHGFDTAPFIRFLLDGLIARGEWRDARRVLDESSLAASKNDAVAAWHELVSAHINAALDPAEGPQSQLVNLVRGRPFSVAFFKNLIANLRKAGRLTTAREIVTFAQGMYPDHVLIEQWRGELDAEIAAVREQAKPVVEPVRAVAASREELVETTFMARLAELDQKQDYAAGLQAIRTARLAKPEWLSARDVELSRQEVRFGGLGGDVLTMRAGMRFFNNGDAQRIDQLVAIAREFHAAGKTDSALYVIKDALAKSPDHPVAMKLLIDWSPKPESLK